MMLTLDIGNTHMVGGIFTAKQLLFRFRHSIAGALTSDQIGIFLKNVLQENGYASTAIEAIAYCSVVPSIDYSLTAACKKYFHLDPFVLKPESKTALKITIPNPAEIGADIVAGMVAATTLYPQRNLLIIDLGTVTTLTAVTKNREFLGTTFIAGMYTTMNALHTCAAKLFPVEIIKPSKAIGRTTIESMQAGIFWGQLGALRELIKQMTKEAFPDRSPLLIATGGFAHLFTAEKIFDYLEPDLVLQGVALAYQHNQIR